jgi:hypothetical protein
MLADDVGPSGRVDKVPEEHCEEEQFDDSQRLLWMAISSQARRSNFANGTSKHQRTCQEAGCVRSFDTRCSNTPLSCTVPDPGSTPPSAIDSRFSKN